VKITDLITVQDLEATSCLQAELDQKAQAMFEEAFERLTKNFAPLFLTFGKRLVGEHKDIDPRIVASSMLSILMVLDVALQRKMGDSNETN
jgi:hypothetical protein